MISAIVSRIIILLFGNLYPAYASYKAVRTKNVKEYVKWMMYWIVFAFFSCIETFTDIFLSWFPFYYEVKVIIVLWLLSPATKGSSTLYRKFVHPMLTKRENEIDEYITQAKEKGYTAVLQLGSKGVNYATNVIMQTAIKTLSNGVQTSQSDNAIADRMHRDRTRNNNNFITDGDDLTDGDEQMIIETESRMRRSQSADSALNRPTTSRYNLRSTPDIIYEDSSEDEMIIHEDKPAPDFTAITGSARSREAPAPKTTSNRTTRTNRGAGVIAPPRPTSSGIRGRRKIKPEPLIEMDQEIVVE